MNIFLLLLLLTASCQEQVIVAPLNISENPEKNERAEPNTTEQTSKLDALVNKAGRQRMLSQRIAKCYFMLGMNINSKEAQEQLNKSIALFKTQHELLKNNSISPDFSDKLQITEKIWNKYEALVLSKVERGSAEKLIEMSNELLEACNANVSDLCEYANSLSDNFNSQLTNKEICQLINQSGRQRMLTQKLSLKYLAFIWDVQPATAAEEIPIILNDFSTNLGQLQTLKYNNEDVKKLYLDILDEWKNVASACLYLDKQNRENAAVFLKNTEIILTTMNKVTSLYEKQFDLDTELLSEQGRR